MFKLSELFVEIGADQRPLNHELTGLRTKLASVANTRFNLPGGGLIGALGVGAAALGLRHVINAASDLSESANRVSVTFGESSGKVTAFADDMASRFGLVKKEVMESASNFAGLGKGVANLKGDDLAQFSTQFTKLAADMSSFNNVSFDEAANALRSGLSGEAEPLKRFGVVLTESAMKAYALSHGIKTVGGELSESDKFYVRQALILEKLGDAHGDLERTQDGYANSSRAVMGRLENLAASIGQQLMPAFESLMGLFNEVVANWSSGVGKMDGGFQWFVEGVQGAIEYVRVIWRNWDAIIERTGVMIGGWATNFGETLSWLGGVIGEFLGWFSKNWVSILRDGFNATLTLLKNLGENFASFGAAAWEWVKSGFTSDFKMEWKPLLDGFQAETEALKLPELKLSSVADQLAEIDERMVQSEQKRAERKDRAEAEADKAKAIKGDAEDGKKEKAKKLEVSDLAAFAEKLQQGAFGKDKVLIDQLGTQRQMLGVQQQQLAEQRRANQMNGGGVAAAPA